MHRRLRTELVRLLPRSLARQARKTFDRLFVEPSRAAARLQAAIFTRALTKVGIGCVRVETTLMLLPRHRPSSFLCPLPRRDYCYIRKHAPVEGRVEGRRVSKGQRSSPKSKGSRPCLLVFGFLSLCPPPQQQCRRSLTSGPRKPPELIEGRLAAVVAIITVVVFVVRILIGIRIKINIRRAPMAIRVKAIAVSPMPFKHRYTICT